MKRYFKSRLNIFMAVAMLLIVTLPSCYHAPSTAWTPSHSRRTREKARAQHKKPSEKKLAVIRMW